MIRRTSSSPSSRIKRVPPSPQRPVVHHSNRKYPSRCSMFNWIGCSRQRSIRIRRTILLPVIIFLITTSLLYAVMEHQTTENHFTTLRTVSQVSCQLKNETIRAINLASTDSCKEILRTTACEMDVNEDFFPRSLPRFCPLQKGHFGDIAGCRTNDDITVHSTNNLLNFDSKLTCIDHCLKLSVSFAEYNHVTGRCVCLSSFENSTCTDLEQSSTMIYRTGHVDFGNHLDKRHQTPTNPPAKIVFFLTVGGRRNLRQIKRLLRAIYSRHHYYLIHIDSREDYLYRALHDLSKNISNIHLMNQRYPTTWGASVLLTAHLQAFKQIFEELKWDFSFILNLSESDFPLKPIQVLTNFLSMYTSYNFLRSHNREPFKFIQSQGMFHTFIHCNNYMYRIGPRPLIQNIIYDGGSDWYVLNREFVHYVTYGDDELVNGLRHIFNYSLLPCEAFFHTVLSNSMYCDTYIRNNLRLVHWNRERGCKCQHKNVVDWCGCSPVVYRTVDKTTLNETIDKPLFFARKFDPTIDESILDWLDEKISHRDFSTGAFYLQNIYHSNEEITITNHGLNFIDSYARTTLVDYQQYRRDCYRDDTLHLEQIHFIYQSSLFQGYSFLYKFHDGEVLELFIKLNQLAAICSNAVKRFEVGLDLDSKEMVFLDRSRTFTEPKLIKVLVEWNAIIHNDTSLIIHSPNGAILQRVKLHTLNESVIVDIFFPVVSPPSMIGIWHMSIIQENNETVLASLNFLVLSPHDEQLLNIEDLTLIKNFWSISDICTTNADSSPCRDVSNQTILTKITAMNNCFQQRWSFFFHDIKSDW